MTDREASAAILELDQRHTLGIVKHRHSPCCCAACEDRETEVLTGVLGVWLIDAHGITVLPYIGRFIPFQAAGISKSRAVFTSTCDAYANEPYPTRLQAQLAALRHVTGGK